MTASAYTALFHQRYGFISHPHLRTLAFLLDSPSLINPPGRAGQLVNMALECPDYHGWLCDAAGNPSLLAELDADMLQLHSPRLGLYAERLLAFFLRHTGRLVQHGLQIRAGKNATIGEFDFLLNHSNRPDLLHWELATKFYLLAETGLGQPASMHAFIGPNRADSLGRKMERIFERQLKLSEHEASAAFLPAPVIQAQALIKGWLFYPCHAENTPFPLENVRGIESAHCRGVWGTLAQFNAACGAAHARGEQLWQILPRLAWLAPGQLMIDRISHDIAMTPVQQAGASLKEIEDEITAHNTPLLVSVLTFDRCQNQMDVLSYTNEQTRWFIVPDDWRAQAASRPELITGSRT